MRPTLLIIAAFAIAGAHASWFGSDSPEYTQWSKSELRRWLEEHNVPIPESAKSSKTQLQDLVQENWNSMSAWTYDQYAAAQQSFADLRDSTFDAWDESRLREFLLEQGVVAPSGPREQLVLLAKQKYRAYSDAASSFSSRASASASTAVYGDSQYQASKSLSSIISQATNDVQQALDDSKDYVYSTWDDNQLRTYLEEKGVLQTKAHKKREELLTMMRESYAKVANPVWEAWSTSYMHQWLLDHGLIKTDFQKNREALTAKMAYYYYSANDAAYSTWSDSQLKLWLVEHDIIKSDARLKREKLMKLIQDNYSNAQDTIWSAWSDNQIKDWLVEHGYMRSDAQVKRDQLVKTINAKYSDASARTAAYLTWPDARLRAYLRERGVSEDALPTSRPGLLQETRIRWVQTTNRAEGILNRIRDIINNGVGAVEEKLSRVLEILTGHVEEGKRYANEKYDDSKAYAGEKVAEGRGYANEKYDDSKAYAGEKVAEGRDYAGEKVKQGGQKIKGEL